MTDSPDAFRIKAENMKEDDLVHAPSEPDLSQNGQLHA